MRSTQLLEEEETTNGSGELNLGLGSLIAIFFGLALVCGVFFGFGYMMGHRSPGPYVSSEPLYEMPKSQPTAPKPSAQKAEQSSDANRVIVPADSLATNQPPAGGESSGPPAESPKTASLTPASNPEPPARTTSTASVRSAPVVIPAAAVAPASSTGTIMVQIAAVKNRPDAEALAAALQKNGFSPTIRTESQDKLLHVQVGPFDNRDDARAMRQKLANAGYNAFIK
jgi:cell division protein FtsN